MPRLLLFSSSYNFLAFAMLTPPLPPPPLPPLPLHIPPQLQPLPHPQVSPDLLPFCPVGLRTTLAASWRDASRTRRTSPSSLTRATRPGSPQRRPRTTSCGRRSFACPSSARTWRTS